MNALTRILATIVLALAALATPAHARALPRGHAVHRGGSCARVAVGTRHACHLPVLRLDRKAVPR